MAPAGCPDHETLAALAEGLLSGEALAAVAAHLDDCPACLAAAQAATVDTDPLVAALCRPDLANPYAGEAGCDRAEARLRATVEFGATTDPPSVRAAGPRPLTGAPVGVMRYRLVRLHARGGLGEVHVAVDEELSRQVALKRIQRPRAADPESRRRFLQEAEITARLEHPGVVPVYGLVHDGSGEPCYAMRFIQGETLQEALNRLHAGDRAGRDPGERRLALRDLLGRFVAMCNTVAYAHSRGVLHRDLKPANIMLGAYGETLVVDWGLAKAVEGDAAGSAAGGEAEAGSGVDDHTRTGQALGTPAFMSPEQARGKLDALGPRSDVYSLGATLYCLLTGKPSFDREVGDVLRQVERGEFPAPRRLDPSIDAALEAVCLKAMATEPADRYDSSRALAQDVERWLADEPVSAYREPPAARLARWGRRHKPWVAGVAASLLLTAVGLAAGLWAVNRERERTAAEKHRANEEAAVARAVADFLRKDLLGQADIANQAAGKERNKNITVREALDRAAGGIEARFRGREQTEAAVRLTLGAAYRALGEYPEAQKHLDRSLQLREQALGPDHPDTFESISALAGLDTDRGRFAEAERLYQQVLGFRRANLGPDHPDTLQALNDLGDAYTYCGRYEDAEQLLRQLLERRTAALGPDHLGTLQTMQSLASVCWRRSEYDAAGRFGKRAADGFRDKLGADHPDTLEATAMLALISTSQGRFDEAERLYTAVVETYRTRLGPDHPETLDAVSNLADHHYERGRYDQAIALHEQVLSGRRARLGADHPGTLRSLNSLAACYYELGRFDRAEPFFKQVIDGNRRTLGADHPETIITLHNLGIVYRDRGRHDDAEPLLREALAGAKKSLGLGHEDTRTIIQNLAVLHSRQGKPQLDEANFREAVAFLREHPVSDPLAYAEQLGVLADNLLAQKKYAEAEPMARECLAIRSEKRPDRWVTFYARTTLGGALLGQGRYAEAEPLLIQAFEGMKARESQMRPSSMFLMTEPLERLVQLYDAWGKGAEAARWRRVLEDEKSRRKR